MAHWGPTKYLSTIGRYLATKWSFFDHMFKFINDYFAANVEQYLASINSENPPNKLWAICSYYFHLGTSLVAQTIKRLPTMPETRVRSLHCEDPLEKEMATHSSSLAWKIPWTEEPGRLQSMGSQRVGHDWATSLHFTSFPFRDEEIDQGSLWKLFKVT